MNWNIYGPLPRFPAPKGIQNGGWIMEKKQLWYVSVLIA